MNEPIVMLMTDGVSMVAELVIDHENGAIEISQPLMYGEAMDQNGNPRGAMLRPINYYVSPPGIAFVKPSMWYMLNNESEFDKKVINAYKNELEKTKRAQSGVIAPSNKDIMRIVHDKP